MNLRTSLLFGLFCGLACASSPEPTFYALSLRPGAEQPVVRWRIELRRPALPGHLDRPQITRRESGGRLVLDPRARWAAPLDEVVINTLAENLAQRLPQCTIYTEAGALSAAPQVLVELEVRRFEQIEDGSVELAAEVQVRWPDAHDGARFERISVRATPKRAGAPQVVSALSSVLGRLSDRISRLIAAGPPLPSSALPSSATRPDAARDGSAGGPPTY